MAWLVLVFAIIFEVAATLSLRAATHGSRKWYIVVVAGYGIAFTLLAVTLRLGMPLNVAYGIWAASGVALTSLFGRFIFKEPLTRTMLIGIALIIAGVLLIEVGSSL